MRDDVRRAKAELLRDKRKGPEVLDPDDLLSTGSTLVNLALSGKARGGLYAGKYYHLVGDSDSGKTFLSLTCFAEAAMNPRFKDYELIHDNAEDGSLMDLTEFFGRRTAERIRPPRGTKSSPKFSDSVEEFYYNLDDALAGDRPCIYVLDSMDAVTATADSKKFGEQKKAARRKAEGESVEEKGSYGMAKAKLNSSQIREVFNRLKKTKSILIIISHAKQNVGFGFEEKTYSGGTALKYYAHAQIWTSPAGQIKKKVKNKDRNLGTLVQVRIKKNRQTGRKVPVKVPIYWAFGIDDLGSCIDYLLEEGHWKKRGGVIEATEFEVSLKKDELIAHVEASGLEEDLRMAVGDVWDEIRKACVPERKKRYADGE